jgi:LmbE family N-acetylglucosaminyl deacetylase
MNTQLKLMCILAHPDDESLGVGGILAKYAAERIATLLVTATRGERGWFGSPNAYPGPEALGKIREAQLEAAAATLGVQQLDLLDYTDGDLDQANPDEVIAKIAAIVRRERPQVVVTFGPDGGYGHPDHIAISQFATAALVAAADPSYADVHGSPAHRTAKLYYLAMSADLTTFYQKVFGKLIMTIDGQERRPVTWPDWAITTRVEAAVHWRTVWQAVACHRTQLPNYEVLAGLCADEHRRLWGCQTFYRAFSLVNGGRKTEDDLFVGLR